MQCDIYKNSVNMCVAPNTWDKYWLSIIPAQRRTQNSQLLRHFGPVPSNQITIDHKYHRLKTSLLLFRSIKSVSFVSKCRIEYV